MARSEQRIRRSRIVPNSCMACQTGLLFLRDNSGVSYIVSSTHETAIDRPNLNHLATRLHEIYQRSGVRAITKSREITVSIYVGQKAYHFAIVASIPWVELEDHI